MLPIYRRCEHFDFARHHIGVDALLAACAHLARHLEHVLATKMLGLREILRAHAIGIDDDLGIALAVAQVDEDQAAVIARMSRPASQDHFARNITCTKLAARRRMDAVFVQVIRHVLVSPCVVTLTCRLYFTARVSAKLIAQTKQNNRKREEMSTFKLAVPTVGEAGIDAERSGHFRSEEHTSELQSRI